jgi:hypothetical protein
MSQWTEVLASFYIGGDTADPDFEVMLNSIMGDPFGHLNFGHTDTDSIRVPCGTEGPLQWDINLSPFGGDYHRGCVSVWGNLRDFSSLTDIRSWFSSVVSDFRAHGRLYSAVCTAATRDLRLTITHADIPEK